MSLKYEPSSEPGGILRKTKQLVDGNTPQMPPLPEYEALGQLGQDEPASG